MKILFLRHSESTDDLSNQYGGWADFPLTSRGEEQAHAAISDITSLYLHFDRVLTSPLRRARRVGEIISSAPSVPCETFEYLKERNRYGILSGLEKTAAGEKYPQQVENLNHMAKDIENVLTVPDKDVASIISAFDASPYVHGSERYADLIDRVEETFRLLAAMPDQNVICVTHGRYIQCMGRVMLHKYICETHDCGYMLCDFHDDVLSFQTSQGVDF